MTDGVTWVISTNDENEMRNVQRNEEIESLGFVEGHAYSVLKIYDDLKLQKKI